MKLISHTKKFLKLHQLNIIKESLQKRAHERYQSLSKEKKKKQSNNMVVNNPEISQKMEKKLVEYRKKYYKMRKNVLL